MDLLLTDEQQLLQDSAKRFFADHGGVKRTRSLQASGRDFDRAVHAEMAAQGWFGILVPQDKGGLGLGLTELALVLMEAGSALAPEPIAGAAIAAYALAAGEPSSSHSSDLLEKAMSGEAVIVPGIDRDTPTSGSGAHGLVPMARGCDGFLLAAKTSDGAALYHVLLGAEGLALADHKTVDARSYADVSRAVPSSGHVVAGPASAASLVREMFDMMLIASAAEMVGVMSASLDMTVDYLKIRKQFGKAIGSFQALQHRAVDNLVQVISARTLLFQSCAQGRPTSAMASAVKSYVGAEALAVTKSAIQMHGAIGFTHEHDIGLYLKRAMWLSSYLGNENVHRSRFDALGE